MTVCLHNRHVPIAWPVHDMCIADLLPDLCLTQGSWVRMPLAWERNVTEVQKMLGEVHDALPDWNNVHEVRTQTLLT